MPDGLKLIISDKPLNELVLAGAVVRVSRPRKTLDGVLGGQKTEWHAEEISGAGAVTEIHSMKVAAMVEYLGKSTAEYVIVSEKDAMTLVHVILRPRILLNLQDSAIGRFDRADLYEHLVREFIKDHSMYPPKTERA